MKQHFIFKSIVFTFILCGCVIFLTFAEAGEENNAPLKICMLSGSLEYKSDESLPLLIAYMQKYYMVECELLCRNAVDDLPGLEALEDCGVMLLYTRRMTIGGEQLERVKRYCLAGRPIVGLRTASHAFQNWLELDKLVLGGDYNGHYGSGPITQAVINPEWKNHPVLDGVKPFKSVASLYKNPSPAANVEILMTGKIPEYEEPIAWTRLYKGARIFYTSLGHPQDFENEYFLRMVSNALFWAAKREPDYKPGMKPSPSR